MSAILRLSLVPRKTNQFIRPMSPFDDVSATQRLASSGEQFATAPEYAKTIFRGQVSEFTDALMASLGNATAMSTEDTFAIVELHTGDECTHKVPPSMAKAGGDKATGSPAISIAHACSKKDTLSSLEDEMSNDVTPFGEGIRMKPTDNKLLAKLDSIFMVSARKR